MVLSRFRAAPSGAGPVIVDINLLPPEYRPARISRLTIILFILVTVALLSAVFGYQLRQRTLDEAAELQARLNTANSTISRLKDKSERAGQLEKEVDEARRTQEELKRGHAAFTARRIIWSTIMDTVLGDNAVDITLESVSQSNTTMVVEGFAPNGNRVVEYGNDLLDSDLFSRVELMSLESQVPPDAPLPMPVPVQPTPAPTPTPSSTPPPGVTVTATPVASPAPGTPTAVASPPITSPAISYIVLSKNREAHPDTADRYSVIKGQVIDQNGQKVSGLHFRVRSCCPLWTSDKPGPGELASDGTFEFLVVKGNFEAYIIDDAGAAISEIANDLKTDDDDFTGFFIWEVVFQKRPASALPPATATPSPQTTPSPSGIPATGNERPRLIIPENIRIMLATQVSPVSFRLEIEVKRGGGQ